MKQTPERPDPVEGVYRLDRFDVEVRGRWHEFSRSLFLFALLLVIQQPLRRDALLDLDKTPDILPVTSLRISLIVDVAFIVSYVVVAYRAWGLVRAFRAPWKLTTAAKFVAYYLVSALVALDLAENAYLWRRFSGSDEVTSLSMGPSHQILLVGVAVAVGVNVVLALVTDPRMHWKRRADAISPRIGSQRIKPEWRIWTVIDRGRGTLPDAAQRALASMDRRWRKVSDWLISELDVNRWKEVLAPVRDERTCSCVRSDLPPEEQPPQEQPPVAVPVALPVAAPEQDWGVICCSGGGVRSAAFSLGGLQAMNEKHLYEKAAAVVGVSGGGYTSTAFHVLRWQSGDTLAPGTEHDRNWSLPARDAFTLASPELQWLRRNTKYVLDSVRVAIQGALTLAFGIAVNLLLLAVAIGSVAWLVAWFALASGSVTLPADDFADPADKGGSIGFDAGGDWWVLQHVWWVPVAGLLVFVAERAWDRFHTVPHGPRMFLRGLSTWLIGGGAVLTLLVIGLPALVAALYDYADSSGSSYAGLVHALGIVPTEHCEDVLAAGGNAACGRESTAPDTASGFAAASILTVVTSILAVLASVKGASKATGGGASGFGGFLTKVWTKIKDPIVPWAAVTLIVLVCLVQLVRWTAILTTRPGRLDEWEYVGYAALALLLLKVFSEPNRTSLHHFFRERIAWAFLVRRRFRKIAPLPYSAPLRFSRSRPPDGQGPRLVTCAVANVSDPTLVPAQRGCTPFVFDDEEIGLTDRLLPSGAGRRASATYEFAADYGHRDATVPAAVAMSAAAFSPLAGRENVRLGPYRAVLALGNARLGVWLPNPLWADTPKLARRQARLRDADFATTWHGLSCSDAAEVWRRLGRTAPGLGVRDARPWARLVCEAAAKGAPVRHSALWEKQVEPGDSPAAWWVRPLEIGRTVIKKPGMTRVVREAVGQASIYDRFLYVTDGGHYDNLGLIEALRRRPRRVFVLDASNDREDTFRALGLAVATARMDLDCELVMDPRPMRRLQEQRSAAAWCTGTATFSNGVKTRVFLVKAIMLEDMPWDVETYASSNLDFPRTSTGKQLYSEFDFEAYRMLGSRVVEELLGSAVRLKMEADLTREESEFAAAAAKRATELAAEAATATAAATQADRLAALAREVDADVIATRETERAEAAASVRDEAERASAEASAHAEVAAAVAARTAATSRSTPAPTEAASPDRV